MHGPMPPLNALRAFEAAARHLSLTKAAKELHVTAGALSHQIRGLEDLLGLKLFERRVRAIALTRAGKQLYPGLQTGFNQIREAVAGLETPGDERVLVVSTPTGFAAKWLAPRLHRFAAAHPDIDVRISSTMALADFRTDGVDIAIRMLRTDAPPDAELSVEKLVDLNFVPVCSPKLLAAHGPFDTPAALGGLPLIHDDYRAGLPGWPEWFEAAGVTGVDVDRGLRFSSPDHALDVTIEGGGLFLAHDVLAYDELRTGRLVIAYGLVLRTGRAYHFVCPRRKQGLTNVKAFHAWISREVAAVDWCRSGGAGSL
ncbi:transcriptional regulator GcvA [Phreatobacter stygius]|uniref:Transcriptional regulator GcvA n=1 Tax=Phreatobacter stygius TaxID=1940610 RepID=A0A4D7APL9_9HYPH|nr:transcriptional regulator GcvA [Phreatobacter stygius]QCI62929.1 transcriptional regulator GcvA [Phreatobacter stygius]